MGGQKAPDSLLYPPGRPFAAFVAKSRACPGPSASRKHAAEKVTTQPPLFFYILPRRYRAGPAAGFTILTRAVLIPVISSRRMC